MSTAKMKVVVTGGSGRVGSWVVRQLIERGHEVVNLDRIPAREPLCPYVYIDLADRAQIFHALRGCDAVAHLAEIANAGVPLPRDQVFANNTRIGSQVMQTAVEVGIRRIIYTSTCQVYGCWDHPTVPPERLPFDETHPLRPQNVYALSKVANESYARLLSEHHAGVSVSIFRMPYVMGEWDISPEGLRHRMETPRQHAEGMGTYVHGRDVGEAYALALEKAIVGCTAYHLTAADITGCTPLRELVAGGEGFPALPGNWPDFAAPTLLDRARTLLGWSPKFSLREEFRRQMGREPEADPSLARGRRR